jgi:hypothetical protein
VSAVARRVERLEGGDGACTECGGMGGLAVVLGDDPVPEGRTCSSCGRGPLVIRLVEITKEQWDAQQAATGSGRAA